jgi:hypothetical protein
MSSSRSRSSRAGAPGSEPRKRSHSEPPRPCSPWNGCRRTSEAPLGVAARAAKSENTRPPPGPRSGLPRWNRTRRVRASPHPRPRAPSGPRSAAETARRPPARKSRPGRRRVAHAGSGRTHRPRRAAGGPLARGTGVRAVRSRVLRPFCPPAWTCWTHRTGCAMPACSHDGGRAAVALLALGRAPHGGLPGTGGSLPVAPCGFGRRAKDFRIRWRSGSLRRINQRYRKSSTRQSSERESRCPPPWQTSTLARCASLSRNAGQGRAGPPLCGVRRTNETKWFRKYARLTSETD